MAIPTPGGLEEALALLVEVPVPSTRKTSARRLRRTSIQLSCDRLRS